MLRIHHFLIAAVLLAACAQTGSDAPVPVPPELADHAPVEAPSVALPLYTPESPWNQPIPPDAPLDPNSPAMVAQLVVDTEGRNLPTLSVWEWSVTVFIADEDTPRTDVTLTAGWSQFSALLDVPIPPEARPDPAGDGHLTIIDIVGGWEYDFWQAEQAEDGSWSASWGNRIALESTGIYPQGMSARGSGFASLAGMIWPEELEAGLIEHALVLSLPSAARGGPVWPATESDGRSRADGAIPQGARLQLDPTLDLDAFEMTPYERTIAEALQTYGAFVGDVSGSVELEVINPISYPENPYPWFDQRWTFLTGIPWEHMRVLETGPQTRNPALQVADPSIFLP